MKMLKKLKSDDKDDLIYGYCDPDRNEIFINVEYIWNKYKDTDKFIKNFIDTHIHESVHLAIGELVKRNTGTFYGEEKMVRKLLNERFPRRIRGYYAQDKGNK